MHWDFEHTISKTIIKSVSENGENLKSIWLLACRIVEYTVLGLKAHTNVVCLP